MSRYAWYCTPPRYSSVYCPCRLGSTGVDAEPPVNVYVLPAPNAFGIVEQVRMSAGFVQLLRSLTRLTCVSELRERSASPSGTYSEKRPYEPYTFDKPRPVKS